MNNLLNFNDYRKNIKLMESAVFQEEIIRHKQMVTEGLRTKWKTRKASHKVNRILKDEIALGQEFEENIKNTMKELEKACDEIKNKNKKGAEFTRKVNEIIEEINKVSFDTLSLLGDQNIDFSGFASSATLSTVVRFGVLFAPVRYTMMLKKAYEYFIGLIKQTVRKDLAMLIVNFDQFQSIILQKSMEATTNARNEFEAGKNEQELASAYEEVMKNTMNKGQFDAALKIMKERKQQMEQDRKFDSAFNGYMDAYNNTYKSTAETLKQFMSEDTQKQLDALKNSVSKLGTGDEDLTVFGEMLLSAAEEKALKSCNRIHDNFLKLSEVFKLSNQKQLIDLIVDAEKAEHRRLKKELKEEKEKFGAETKLEEVKFIADEYKKLKDEYELDKLTLDDIKKLKEDTVEFGHKSDDGKREVEKDISKFDILERSLVLPENKDDLKDCSDELKMMLNVGPDSDLYEETYYAYIDILGESVEKALVKEDRDDDKCYLDLNELDSVPEIIRVLRMFDSLSEYNAKKHERILKYISDNVEDFNYKMVLEKFDDIVKMLDEKGYKGRDGLHHEVLKYDELEDDIAEYRSKKDELEKSDEFKRYNEAKNLDDKVKQKVKERDEIRKKTGWSPKDGEFKEAEAKFESEKQQTRYKGLVQEIKELRFKMENDYDEFFDKNKEGELELKVQDYPSEVNLKVKLNRERFDEWKETFKKFRDIKKKDSGGEDSKNKK